MNIYVIGRQLLPFFICLLPFLSSCTRSGNLAPEAPAAVANPTPVFQPRLSTINIPVSFRLITLEDKLNQEFAGVLYKDEDLNGDDLAVTVSKTGRMSMQAEGDKIFFSVPLHVYAKGRWKWEACKICPTIQKTEDTEFDMVVKSQSLVSLTEDYQVKTSTTGNFEWGNAKPFIMLGPIKIGLARFIEPQMRQQMSNLTARLDKEIQNRLLIKGYVQQAWLQLQKPIPIDKKLNAWLTITPQNIRVSPVVARNGELQLQIGLNAYLQTITNREPEVQVNPVLPKLITNSRLANEIQVGLVSELSYAHATTLLKEQLVGKRFTSKDGKDEVLVHDLALSTSQDKMVVMLDVTGKAKVGFLTRNISGKIYLKAVPYYDAATASIKVQNLDYDLNTKDRLLQTASWLAKNKFLQTIQNQISFPVKNQLETARLTLQKTLDQSERLHESVLLKGQITEIVPDTIYLTPTAIKAVVNAKGNLTALIDKL